MVISWAFCRNLKQPKKTNKKTGTQKLRIIEKEYDLPVRFHLRLKKRCQIISTLNDLRKRKLGETFLVFLKNLNLVRNLRKKKTQTSHFGARNRRDYLHFFQAGDPIDCFKHLVPRVNAVKVVETSMAQIQPCFFLEMALTHFFSLIKSWLRDVLGLF